jgi:pimeloyl-ACP methyl ester carboxylesterase
VRRAGGSGGRGARAGPPIRAFTPSHRGGSGPPLVCLHGFTDTWRTWELVLPELERHHDVLALTLPGHAGGPPIAGEVDDALVPDAIERAMDAAGWDAAHLVGNSLGGYTALQLAARGRARSVVAFAPAGGWAADDASWRETLALQAEMRHQAAATAPTLRRSWPRPRAGAARRGSSARPTSTSPPSCSPTRCSASRAARGPRP